MHYELLRSIMLDVGWPILIIGSIYSIRNIFTFSAQIGKTPLSKLIPVLSIGILVTMFSLGIVSTAFMLNDLAHGVQWVFPVFIVWFIIICIILRLNKNLDNDAIAYNKVASQLDKAKTDFLIVISHQLRTPLAGMRWALDALIHDDTLASDHKIKVQNIADSNNKMINLVGNLMSTIRLETGKTQVRLEKLDLQEVVETLVYALTPNATIQNQKIIFTKQQFPIIAEIDKVLFEESFKNILNNAILHGNKNSDILVSISARPHESVISVQNTGPEIPLEKRKKIFEKFSRESFGGSEIIQEIGGLGLYIAKSFMGLMGGDITFESSAAKTTFELRIHR